jgi:hypothetical protein
VGTLTQDLYSFRKGARVSVQLSGGEGRMHAVDDRSWEGLLFSYEIVLGPWHMFSSSSR